ncbi:hypothetical protein Pmani_038252 [Petrolisthes manimaculis]|uniref:Replication protein A C-terminal domain-containing protein n=1 Tax=Petrolisthes manimaculis TaxID=1843537 RepID=A0AAE1TKK4_9EUCA|nr:hypothetical protein Pmani_038252 [Petrolisthes manimaculis]
MWNSNGDGYGGQSEGGFMTGDSQFDSPASKEQARGRKVQNLVPMTLRSIQECGEEGLQVAGTEVHMAVVVGLIRAVDVTSTKVTYTLDDTTAVMDVVQWIESDNGPEDGGRSNLMEMTYCRAAGTMRTHQGKRHLMAFQITPVTDLNVITNHVLSVIHAGLKLQQIQTLQQSSGIGGPATSSTMPNSLVGAGGLGGSMGLGGGSGYSGGGGGMQGLSGQQNMVYQVIHQCPDEAGVSRNAIHGNLTGKISQKQIDEVLDFLSSEGHIYTTIDDDHFKSTDG